MTTWMNLGAIAAGGAVGATCRYLVTVAAMAVPGGSSLWGTTIVNVLGCGLLGGLAEFSLIHGNLPPAIALALRVGFLGSLTTFSTFAAESAATAGEGRLGVASVYVLTNLLVGWAVLLGSASMVRGWMS
ncbi:fluoride efflux transporter FluC [Crateriforma conspicua]|uniref:Fluoride-specific ion channel FluC n=1 Tax=Crateriforma conspicua TaxID=2527996 RepID=A0A5C5Y142_9PLAN|nr:CrcB family protein [Crateriforma conspicua]QDV62691.1 Putative fluoride ion transporter CrcB [Crateriforma conspicua]TWT68539.1 putative fluoride ion transporter CrcB [Crateriforma conspicua]